MSRIAIVEDDLDVSHVIRDTLRDSGHEVVSYVQPNGDILAHLKTYRPDLLILDVRLNPQLSGWNIVHALKEDPSTQDIPVLMCTAAAKQIDEKKDWLNAHHVPVVLKPFDIEDLDALVDRMLMCPST